jgi:Holliday junction DNA helicase RuvA
MMIEYLRGKVLCVKEEHVVLDVGGVGYGLDVPRSTLTRLPAEGEEAELHVAMVVREDLLALYGFSTGAERDAFEIFRDISGVGPRTALDMLSTLSIRELLSALQTGNTSLLTSVPGIGPKKAGRLMLELKSRVPLLTPLAASDAPRSDARLPVGPVSSAPVASEPNTFNDAVAALQSLGFSPAVASRNVAMALREAEGQELAVEDLIKIALKMGR